MMTSLDMKYARIKDHAWMGNRIQSLLVRADRVHRSALGPLLEFLVPHLGVIELTPELNNFSLVLSARLLLLFAKEVLLGSVGVLGSLLLGSLLLLDFLLLLFGSYFFLLETSKDRLVLFFDGRGCHDCRCCCEGSVDGRKMRRIFKL